MCLLWSVKSRGRACLASYVHRIRCTYVPLVALVDIAIALVRIQMTRWTLY
jgi:hypothetical protein